jgi:hypothetical protein
MDQGTVIYYKRVANERAPTQPTTCSASVTSSVDIEPMPDFNYHYGQYTAVYFVNDSIVDYANSIERVVSALADSRG